MAADCAATSSPWRAGGDCSRALVIDGGSVVGIVTPSDLARLIDVYRLAHPATAPIAHRPDAERVANAG